MAVHPVIATDGTHRIIVASALVLAVAAPGTAQVSREEQSGRVKALLQDRAEDPTATATIVTPTPKLTLLAGPDGTAAKAQLGVQFGSLTFAATFAGPLRKTGDTPLIGLSGLPGDTTAGAAITYTRWNPSADDESLLQICSAYTAGRLRAQDVELSGDTALTVDQAGRWQIHAPGEPGRVTWSVDGAVVDRDVMHLDRTFAKPGIHRIVVTVVRDDRLAKDFDKATVVRTEITTTRSWLVGVNATPSTPPAPIAATPAIRMKPDPSGRTIVMQMGRQVPFDLTAPPNRAATIDFGDGSAVVEVATGVSGTVTALHAFPSEGIYPVSAGVEVEDGRFVVVQARTSINADCSWSAVRDVPEFAARWVRAVDWSAPLIFSAKGEIGQSTFDFVDGAGAPQPTAKREPWLASGTVGTILPNGLAVALTAERNVTYKAGSATELCKPFAAAIETCDETVVGGPTERISTVVSLTFQKVFNEHLGLQPRFSYRHEGAVKSIDLPVYFLQNTARGFNGGVTTGWRSDTGVTATLFVGVFADMFER